MRASGVTVTRRSFPLEVHRKGVVSQCGAEKLVEPGVSVVIEEPALPLVDDRYQQDDA